MDRKNVWFIKPKTNLHVGNENTSSFGLIDLAIQRDAVTNLPCINSSSLKGALKEYAAYNGMRDSLLKIFGSDNECNNSQKGSYVFFDARIIAVPRQCETDDKPYELVTCDEVLNSCVDFAKAMGIDISADDLGKGFEKVTYDVFNELCSDENLPIIARNKLENGESKNLWYEQVLPAESVLFTVIDDKGDGKLRENINGKIVQIGANATIGYGYCLFNHL